MGLWVGQRNLIQNDERELRRSADSIQQFLLKGDDKPDVVQQELLLHSRMRAWEPLGVSCAVAALLTCCAHVCYKLYTLQKENSQLIT